MSTTMACNTEPIQNQDVLATGRPTKSKVFGIKKSSGGIQANAFGKFDYEQKYEEDPPGEEAGEYARLWLTYLDETELYDRDKVDSWKDTIDILLVFAGLFSAVVTTFVIESTQHLQTDYTRVSANLLFELVQIQRAATNGVPAGSIPPSLIDPNTPFVPSTTDSVINALWFTSLALALVTALLAVLTKQWLYQYSSLISGTPRERSRLRHYRSQGLETWKVPDIIELLPVLMHTALALFLVGLVIFLIPLKTEIAWIVGVIAGIAYIFYVVSALLPIYDPQCPYTTKLTILARTLWRRAHHCWHSLTRSKIFYTWGGEVDTVTITHLAGLVTAPILFIFSSSLKYTYQFYSKISVLLGSGPEVLEALLTISPSILSIIPLIAIQSLLVHRPRLISKRPKKLRNDREHEMAMVQQNGISIDTGAISWLYSASTNPSVRKIVNQSICALPYGINGHLFIGESLYDDLSGFVPEEEYSTLQVGTLRRLILAWLHYGNTIDEKVIRSLDSQKIKPHDSGLAELCDFLGQDPIDLLIKSINDTTTSWPLVVWSFLFRHAEYRNGHSPHATRFDLAKTLLTWDAAKKLFTWSDDRITLVSDQDPITLSQISTKYPDIIAKWIFTYLSKYFRHSISDNRKSLDFILLGEAFHTRYSLFKTIYEALTRPSLAPSAQNCSEILSLVRSFEIYVMAVVADVSSSANTLDRLAKVIERDIIWSAAFFQDDVVMPETRVHLFQIYNTLWKVHAPRPVREKTMARIHDYLIRLNAPPTIESQTTALHLLTVITLPRFCEFLCTLQDPRLDIVLIHAGQGMTSYQAKSFLSIYKRASRNPSTLYGILHDPSVLEELCKCMAIANYSDRLLEIACVNPSNPGWKDCYKRLLNFIQDELQSFHFEMLTSEDDPEDPNPLFHLVYGKEWFSLYSLCYHLRSILEVDLSGAEFMLEELSDIFPQLSPDQICELNVLVLNKEKTYTSNPPNARLGSNLYHSLRRTLKKATCVSNDNLDEKGENLPV